MKKISFLNFALFFCLLFLVSFSGIAFADPINDSVFNVKKVGWFPSNATPCNIVCRRQGTHAEHELRTYLCKMSYPGNRVGPEIPVITDLQPYYRQQLYGNNFSSNLTLRKLCVSATPHMRAVKNRRFMCLCVR